MKKRNIFLLCVAGLVSTCGVIAVALFAQEYIQKAQSIKDIVKLKSAVAFESDFSSTSTISSLNDELSEYKNHPLGISIQFPKKVSESSPPGADEKITTAPVNVTENGEVITFSRGTPLPKDTLVRAPYYSTKYLNDTTYPYQIYAAKIASIGDLKAFTTRVYGEGCTPGGPSIYEDKPEIQTFTIEGTKKCPSLYPVGDVIIWNQKKQVAVGYQPGWNGYFPKPYHVDVSTNQNPYYEIKVDWLKDSVNQ